MSDRGSLRLALAAGVAAALLATGTAGVGPEETYWPYWRGPAADGMAVGDAPLRWTDTQNVRWKVEIPGLGNSSPIVWGDQIFVTTAIKTGTLPPGESSAPLVVDYKGRKQVVVSASGKVRSYDLADGRLIWECAGLGMNTIPQPVRQDEMVFVMSGYNNPKLMAIRLGREGDLTGSDAIVWSQTRGNSYTPSPVIYDNKLYVLTDTGMLSCYNARTGEPYYQQVRLPKTYSFKSSPVGANGKLYLASENEDVIVLRMGETFEVLATNTMPDQVFIATPAITGGEIFLRSKTRLYCIRGS